ncbi:hypothetical protein Q4488_16690 [Amphritea sp. 1_MG-2023]|uniref:hypothetical protein n=1 Tax=Amphritea sp. 1_MG-2023 TaxID=3062670 RepID=UPI0026E13CBD|nr:hypothetical protein [Amphritea sp. 1_MG-2023]MDO6565020.1 hypothetical protein [Amphritea sp. 1_MG-2023]
MLVLGYLAVVWGIVGITFIFGNAIVRIGTIGFDTFAFSLNWYHWVALLVSVLFMGFAEGYRGFQRAYSPRVAARLLYLRDNVTPVRLIFAPLFCMGFFDIRRARMIATYCLLLGILVLIQLVHMLDQPWRGIIDLGVVVGLSWGCISIVLFVLKAFMSETFEYSPEMPELKNAP